MLTPSRLVRIVAAGAALFLAPAALAQTEPAYRPGGAVTDTNPQPMKMRCWNGTAWIACSFDTVVKGAAVDKGAVITTAGTAQQLMAANANRRGFAIQNQSSGACYISGQGTATQNYHSLLIAAGAYYETPPSHVGTGAISVICAVSAAAVYAREY